MQSRIFNSKTLPRQLLAMGMDVLCAWLALLLSISLREDRWIWPHADQALTYFLAPALAIPLMVKFGLYRAIFRYTGFAAMVTTMKAIAAYGVLFFCYVVFVGNPTHVPRSVGILQPLMFLLLIGGNRAFIRGLFSYSGASEAREQGRMLIYGAGETGIQTAAAIHTARRYTLIGFVDDDPAKIGRSINGAEVWSPLDLPRVIRDSAVTDVLLAIPSMGRAQRNAIIRSMRDLSVHVRSVPGMADLTSKAREELNKTFGAPGKLSWWHKTVGTMYNLAERSPAFKRVFEAAQGFVDDVSYYATDAAEQAPRLLPKLETWRDIAKRPITAADNAAVAKPVFEGTLVWTRDEAGKPVRVDDLVAAAEKLTAEEKARSLLRQDKISAGMLHAWQGLPLEQYEKLVESRYESQMLKAGIVWTPAELKSMFKLTDDQVALYKEFRAATDRRELCRSSLKACIAPPTSPL